jgi:hypothetical protein
LDFQFFYEFTSAKAFYVKSITYKMTDGRTVKIQFSENNNEGKLTELPIPICLMFIADKRGYTVYTELLRTISNIHSLI